MINNAFCEILTDNIKEAKVLLTGIPFDKNVSIGKGAGLAPGRLRGLSQYFPPLTMDGDDVSNCKIYDFGDILDNGLDSYSYFENIKKRVYQNIDLNKLNLYFGGDHSVAIPLQRAFFDRVKEQNKKIAIIHIDAHPDICDVYDGSDISHACPIRRAIDYGYLEEDITLIGIRAYELQEVEYLNKHPEIKVFKASEINESGISNLLTCLKEKYKDHLIYLSYDIDANDPCFAPGTGTPEPFGLDSKVTLEIIKFIFKNLNVVAMDLVEIAPPLDSNDLTSWLGLKTLYEIFKLVK